MKPLAISPNKVVGVRVDTSVVSNVRVNPRYVDEHGRRVAGPIKTIYFGIAEPTPLPNGGG